MGKYTLSPLEELQLAKKKAREERAIAERREVVMGELADAEPAVEDAQAIDAVADDLG